MTVARHPSRILPMGLKDLPLAFEYRSDSTNVVENFYIPCLRESVQYWRAVGFFTSRGLCLAAKGLAAFIAGRGRMRLVASPWLEPDDIEAFQRGYVARENIIERAILRQLEEQQLFALSPIAQHRLECIAWLVAEERLDIKVACPVRQRLGGAPGIYHEKIGLFLDSSGDCVAFTGSPNETVGGLVDNFESIDVYVSWDDPHGRVERKRTNFQRLWDNVTPGLEVVQFPVAARRRLLQFRPRTRPERDPEVLTPGGSSPSRRHSFRGSDIGVPPDIQLRRYQEAACDAWMSNQGRGLLTMATGSGKTVTALASVVRLAKEQGKLFVVVAVPFQHLVDQWAYESRRFGLQPVLAYHSRDEWESRVGSRILDYNHGNRDNALVVTTHDTFIGDAMQKILPALRGPALLVADEVHHLGARQGRNSLPEVFSYRMGLSATPQRWFDDEGTAALEDYFGRTVFEFSLKEAIAEGCLSKYYYHPVLVDLTPSEVEQYGTLTRKIARLFGRGATPDDDDALGHLLRRRAETLNNAVNKISALAGLIQDAERMHHALFYCVPGQIDEVTRLLGNSLGIRTHRFTVDESAGERRALLESFARGELQALVAIRCLDEGVDVPAAQVAYLLASSGNPREFIQRRGRILRKAAGKDHAVIYDMITVPPLSALHKQDPGAFNVERRIVKKELVRFREFADCAENRFQASQAIWEVAKRYNLLDF